MTFTPLAEVFETGSHNRDVIIIIIIEIFLLTKGIASNPVIFPWHILQHEATCTVVSMTTLSLLCVSNLFF